MGRLESFMEKIHLKATAAAIMTLNISDTDIISVIFLTRLDIDADFFFCFQKVEIVILF